MLISSFCYFVTLVMVIKLFLIDKYILSKYIYLHRELINYIFYIHKISLLFYKLAERYIRKLNISCFSEKIINYSESYNENMALKELLIITSMLDPSILPFNFQLFQLGKSRGDDIIICVFKHFFFLVFILFCLVEIILPPF